MDILYDIFGVHKALVFGRLQRADYAQTDFMNDIKSAERKAFGGDICTQLISEEDLRLKLSFYPKCLINDDIFEVMACHFAVSSVVRSMRENLHGAESLHICSVVVPVAICSRYDVDARHHPTINNVDHFMNRLATSDFYASRIIDPDIANAVETAKTIQMLISHLNVNNDNHKVIVIIFNRQKQTDNDRTRISVFGCDDSTKLEEFRQNHFICFDFQVSYARNNLIDNARPVVRCWMTFGIGQRLRFYPEYTVWIIPHLFVRSTKMTAYQFLERIYSEHYKHGWRVSLDDPTLNKYYHIITQHEHISNNYNRDEVKVEQKDVQRLLRDHLEDKLKWETVFGAFGGVWCIWHSDIL